MIGVIGAGVAFALREVISSTAGWVAISLGDFYSIGDRIQLGGITGDVIDIGILRSILQELVGAGRNRSDRHRRVALVSRLSAFWIQHVRQREKVINRFARIIPRLE